jgi:HEPN domain-containing protein
MNATVREWVAKAEADLATAGRELAVQDTPNHDAVCFHAQQAIEKLIKGLLIHLGVVPPRTHDLVHLHRLLEEHCPSWCWDTRELRFLSRAAVDFRYPGEAADYSEAVRAHELALRMRDSLRRLFGPTP